MANNSKPFKLSNFVTEKESFHVARTTITSGTDLKLHSHDYAEIFWIKDGDGQHLINGEEIKVSEGYICMIRPEDKHTFKPNSNSGGLTITNIAFSKENLDYLKNRYFENVNSLF